MNLFQERSPGASKISEIKRWVEEEFVLGEEFTVMVTELRCTEPGCPPLETVVAILGGPEPRQYKLHKGAAEVNRADIARLR
ncbi:MAG: hypothetical protein ACK5AZ_07205 [Bryobacteraceae bacterium]